MKFKTAIIGATMIFSAGITLLAGEMKMMSLYVRNGYLRSEPSFLGKTVTSVKYGDRLGVIEEKGQWVKVAVSGSNVSGWIHSSALTQKKIALKAGTGDAELAASSGEMALAGKGFNSDVEAQFKTQNKDVDFSWVDRMEKMIVPMDEIGNFLKEGKVSPKEGGAR